MTILGIDLGTTHSAIAVFENGQPRLIKNVLGECLTPSVIAMDPSGHIIVGTAAREMAATLPDHVAMNFKPYLGSDKPFHIAGETFNAVELTALLLKALKRNAEAFLKKEIRDVIISVPACFNHSQRKSTIQAAEFANLSVIRLVNAPTAAALVYNIYKKENKPYISVFNLGGGTFDISIIKKDEDVMEVRASAGDAHLGGEDFTEVIYQYFMTQLNEKGVILKKHDQYRLRRLAERYKRQIHRNNPVHFALGETYHHLEMSSKAFEQHSERLIGKLSALCERAILDAKLEPHALNHVVLVGGASRMPFIRGIVGLMFQKLPKSHLDADLVVAQGAAIQAALITKDKSLNHKVMTDVVSHTLGIKIIHRIATDETVDGAYYPIIERNSHIPLSHQKSVFPAHPQTKTLDLSVYQGESRHEKNNIYLGNMSIPIESKPHDEKKIRLRFSYDASGLLEIEAQNSSFDQMVPKVLKNSETDLTKDEIEKTFEKLASIKYHPRDQIENRTLMIKAAKLFQELLGEERQTVGDIIDFFEAALETQDPDQIDYARTEVNSFFRYYNDFFLGVD